MTPEEWLADDPDPATRAELRRLLDAAAAGDASAQAEIADSFRGPLEFGTAGLRGRMGPGPHRMNRATVSRAAAGIGAYLLERHEHPAAVIGFDARHNSSRFARNDKKRR